jgi:hypothetical protein
MNLAVCAGIFTVNRFSSSADLAAKLGYWASGFATMKLALGFTLHGWPTTLKFCSLRHGVTTPANDHSTGSS